MKLNRRFVQTGFLCLGLSVASTSWSDDKPAEDQPDIKIFEQLDKNQDGKLTADEIPEDKRRFFDQLARESDADGDGIIEKEEYLAPPKEKPSVSLPEGKRPGMAEKPPRDFGEIFNRADKNGDGKVSLEEIPEKLAARLKPLMEKLGKDEITREEFEKLANRRKQPPESGQPGKGGRPNLEQLFESADQDGDGKILLKDVTDRGRMLVERAYDKLGKEPDEPITLDELKEAMPPRPEGPPEGFAGRPGGKPPRRPGGEMEDGERPPFGPPGHPKFFMLLDEDEDGMISKDELEKLSELFRELDEDDDGMLSPPELLGPPPHARDDMPEGEEMPRRPGKNKKGGKRPPPPADSTPE